MGSNILENSNFEKDIQYEWNIDALHVLSEPINNFYNIIRKVKWSLWVKLEVTGQVYSEVMFGESTFSIPDLDTENFILYENLSPDIIINWIKIAMPTIEDDLKQKLLSQQIYATNEMQLPWIEQNSSTVNNVEIISTNFPEETTIEETAVEPVAEETLIEETPAELLVEQSPVEPVVEETPTEETAPQSEQVSETP